MKTRTGLILAAIFLGVVVVAYISLHSSSSTVVSKPAASDDRQSKVMVYMGCLGFSASAATRALNAADGDVDKVLTMAHMSVSGDLSGGTPLNEQEKTCLKSSGL
jgi:hypothetical protein